MPSIPDFVMAMRRADRRTSHDDNSRNNLRSHRPEPASTKELKTRLATVQSQRDEAKNQLKVVEVERDETKDQLRAAEHEQSLLLRNIEAVTAERDSAQHELTLVQATITELKTSTQTWQDKADNFQQLYLNEQGKVQVAKREVAAASDRIVHLHTEMEQLQGDVASLEEKSEQNYQLYVEQKDKYDSLFISFETERERANQLLIQYEQADAERLRYVNLYEETRTELKSERRSKAGIKGWETRRKRENERLKQEIGDMIVLLKESMERKEQAVQNLEIVAARMDRIQDLVESVGGEDSKSLGLLQKFQRIWRAIREILAE